MDTLASEVRFFRHDHVALVVKDLKVTREFYEYLGGRVVSKPSLAFMEIALGEIRLHVLPRGNEGEPSPRPEDGGRSRIDHLCLRVDSVEALVRLQERLNVHSSLRARTPCAVEDSPPLGEGGKVHVEERPPRKTLYFEDPDGIMLEVRAYADN
jgi:catechol 2,3-dioxygenase-like lactoylglutathione lyase family enzyme